MNIRQKPAQPRTQQGAALLEVLISMLIFSFGILSILGLQAAMLRSASNSELRTEGSLIAQRAASQSVMTADAGGFQTGVTDLSAEFGLPPGSVTRNVQSPDNFNYRIDVTVNTPNGASSTFTQFATTQLGPNDAPLP